MKLFAAIRTIDGAEVIATDTGRPVAIRDDLRSANGVAYALNDAAKRGPHALASAFTRMR